MQHVGIKREEPDVTLFKTNPGTLPKKELHTVISYGSCIYDALKGLCTEKAKFNF